MIAPRRKGRSGGSAAAAGVDFQARLAAWVACAILAETDAAPLWDWPEGGTFEAVYAETEQPTDDLLVRNSAGAEAYVQAKYRLESSPRADSPFASAIGQFVRQVRGGRVPGHADDRLVLGIGPTSTAPVRDHLPRILTRLRGLRPTQPISSAAVNAAETKILEVLLEHLRREWLRDAGSAASDDDERALLGQLRVSVHDLYGDGAAIREAKGFLRGSVLRQPGGAGAVFDALISAAASFGVDQTGVNRIGLQDTLTRLDIELRAVPSYRGDIDKLIAHSGRMLRHLQQFASVLGKHDAPITIERTASTALADVLERRSVVVTGDPGAGKSATLFEFGRGAIAGGRDVLVLVSDTLAAASLGDLRQELGLEHDLVDVLVNWPGVQAGFLVIDALDAARGEHTQQTTLDLIGVVGVHAKRWRIAASIRRFDLRYNQDLLALFAGPGSGSLSEAAFRSSEFPNLSHFNVPVLSEEELGQLETLDPGLHSIVSGAGHELRALLRVPFNLRLLAVLAALGVARSELSPITTQVQLLEKYWQHRVLGGDGGDARETVLRATCEKMIVNRALRISRSALQGDVNFAVPLQRLLSAHVLAESEANGVVDRDVLSFEHHVLFDYAVSRLLFRGTPQTMLLRTQANPELLLVVRPSYDVHFRYLWERGTDRQPFWDAAIDVAEQPELPAIGVVIGPGVGAQLVESLADLAPLRRVVEAGPEARQLAAQAVLQHLVGARLAAGELGRSIPAGRRLVWSEIAAALTVSLRVQTAYPVRNLLMELCATPDGLDDVQRVAVGSAARVLLQWSLDAPQHDQHLIRAGISAVARTFASDPTAAETTLRLLLQPSRLDDFGYMEMPALAGQVPHLLNLAPNLVRDIYDVAFDHQETSDEPTPMRQGVLSLTSRRSHDYDSAHYALAAAYPSFLKAAPDQALDALSRVWLSFVRHRASGLADAQPPIVVRWGGSTVEIQPDGSYWRERDDSRDDEVKMLIAFGEWFAEAAARDAGSAGQALATVRAAPRPTALWRRVLRVATDHPEHLAGLLHPLLITTAALSSRELEDAIGRFLHDGFSHYSRTSREQIERAIMSLPEAVSAPGVTDSDIAREYGERARNRLLAGLDPAELVRADAQDLLTTLTAENGGPELPHRHYPAEWTGRDSGERDDLAERGVDIDDSANRRLQDLQQPVEEFANAKRNDAPQACECDAVEAALRDLWRALQRAHPDGVHELQADAGWGHASAAAAAIARCHDLVATSPVAFLARQILLAAATHQLPRLSEGGGTAEFDEFPSWSGQAPRIDAALGLLYVAKHHDLTTPEVLTALDHLSTDDVPAVRFEVARGLSLLRTAAPDLMWTIADRMLAEDASAGVLDALVEALPRMTLPDDVNRLQRALRSVFARVAEDRAGAADARNRCLQSMTSLYVVRGTEDAGQFVKEAIVDAIRLQPERALQVLHVLRDALTYGVGDPSSNDETAVRRRAIALAEGLLEQSMSAFSIRNAQLAGPILDREHPDMNAARTTAKVIDGLANEVYFATGIFDERQKQKMDVSLAQRERLYREAASLLDRLCDVGFAPSTHRVIETHEGLIPFDPRGAFLRIARTVTAGQAGGYHGDSLAAALVVKLVERYLAEHRTLLQQDDECRQALIDVLDIFVRAGWPEALRLTYGLQDIFR
jgi:hypothetical protein